MTTLSEIKDITITCTKRSNEYEYANLQIRHKNNLILDNITLLYYTNSDLVLGHYTKPYCEKYLGLVVEWIVNNRPAFGNIKCTQNVAR